MSNLPVQDPSLSDANSIVGALSTSSATWVPKNAFGENNLSRPALIREFLSEFDEIIPDIDQLEDQLKHTPYFSSRFVSPEQSQEETHPLLQCIHDAATAPQASVEDISDAVKAYEGNALKQVILGKFSPYMETSISDPNATKDNLSRRTQAAVDGPGYSLICMSILGKLGADISSSNAAPVNNKIRINTLLEGNESPLSEVNIEKAHKAAQSLRESASPQDHDLLNNINIIAQSYMNMFAMANEEEFKQAVNHPATKEIIQEAISHPDRVRRADNEAALINPLQQSRDTEEEFINPLQQFRNTEDRLQDPDSEPDLSDGSPTQEDINAARDYIRDNKNIVSRPPKDINILAWWIAMNEVASDIAVEAGSIGSQMFSDLPFFSTGIELATQYFNLFLQTQIAMSVVASSLITKINTPNDDVEFAESLKESNNMSRDMALKAIGSIENNKASGGSSRKAELTEDVRRGFGAAK